MDKLKDYDKDFVNEDHIDAFIDALEFDDSNSPKNGTFASLGLSRSSTSSLNLFHSFHLSGPSQRTDSDNIIQKSDENNDKTDNKNNIKPDKSKKLNNGDKPPEKIISKSDWSPIYNELNSNSNNVNSDLNLFDLKKIENDISTKNDSKNQFKPHLNKSDLIIPDAFKQGWSYQFFSWPILLFAIWWIGLLAFFYLFIRIYVALFESFITWRGKRRSLRTNLRNSKNYKEWIKNALALDNYLNLNKWKSDPKNFYYDWKTLLKIVKILKKINNNPRHLDSNIEKLVLILQNCVKTNFAGIEGPILYSQTYYNTKTLIEDYYNQLQISLNLIINSDKIDPIEKYKIFKHFNSNYGKTALCLSGGACFSYTHFGIVKALIDNDLLPKIISGTSGGGLVAVLTCTRTNKELMDLLIPELAYKITACSDPISEWLPRWWKTGARFDSADWAKKSCWFTLGSLTFKEAYQRTGKILNISTVPSDSHSPVILCNHITSPNCVIWSSLLASSAVPGILNPVVLMMKNNDGKVVPFSFGSKWKDGSLRTDIPVEALNTYFNVKFSIVSQVNPHIALFFYAPKGSVGRPVSRRKGSGLRGGFVGAALENFLKLEITKWLKLIKSLDLLPRIKDQDWSNIWLQRFSGTITLWPKIKIKDFYHILSDPTPERLKSMIQNGELTAYPKLLFIKHRLSIERCIERGLKESRKESKFYENNQSTPTINPEDFSAADAQEDLDNSDHLESYDSEVLKTMFTDGLGISVKTNSNESHQISKDDSSIYESEDISDFSDYSYKDDIEEVNSFENPDTFANNNSSKTHVE
ncbi:patatin-like phospholipase domain-containing protein [Ascoidea rubescens DSM 1968]|uniref:Patatin-like phospholipase domain-containing protein n=1 Tax=Ascoidea rubescens DSM 1968 TaxID=1344418 RepID=A0A1D2VQ21_9ASCO|nr:patatin-domain-containing protein [Ascoidea rubescens DSM 1968]ODV63723.1 patatin-domain-containing protein [Ascoidea rubescens DSM 1968]